MQRKFGSFWKKRENIHKSQVILIKITPLRPECQRTSIEVSTSYQQNLEFWATARRKITDTCLFVFVFSRGDRIDLVVLTERTHSNGN